MSGKKQITVVGGDLRQAYLANRLAWDGYAVTALCLDHDIHLDAMVARGTDARALLQDSDVIILPLPVTSDGEHVNAPFANNPLPLDEILLYAKKDAILLGGKVDDDFRNRAHTTGFDVADYLEREELAVKNAVSTSEGAVGIAMAELPITIFGSTCLVTGFGRVARVLARLLKAMGAHVIVAARKQSDLASAQIEGCEAIHISQIVQYAGRVELLFNTVPAMVLGETALFHLKKDCLVIDLASKPGGVDFEMAKRLGIKTIWALSLPGKVAPYSAGEIIKETVLNILNEKGGLSDGK